MSSDENEKFECGNCGGSRNHVVLCQHKESWQDDESAECGRNVYIVAQCAGCDVIRFALKSWSTLAYPEDNGYERETPWSVKVFPEGHNEGHREDAFSSGELPEKVEQMYREARLAFESGAYTLCGAGLRAIVEALCRHQGLHGKLVDMINELVAKGFLAKAQADLLHEERYLGNAAVHEMQRPTKFDLEDGFGIIEGLLKTIYVLPGHGARLRKKREARGEGG